MLATGSCCTTFGDQTSGPHSVERVTYEAQTREVAVTLMDGSRLGTCYPLQTGPACALDSTSNRKRSGECRA